MLIGFISPTPALFIAYLKHNCMETVNPMQINYNFLLILEFASLTISLMSHTLGAVDFGGIVIFGVDLIFDSLAAAQVAIVMIILLVDTDLESEQLLQ